MFPVRCVTYVPGLYRQQSQQRQLSDPCQGSYMRFIADNDWGSSAHVLPDMQQDAARSLNGLLYGR
jgi:hypothetical protein